MLVTVVLVVAVCVLAAGVAVHIADLLWARRLMLRRRVVVNLVSGRAVTGVLWARHGRVLVLKQAQVLEPGLEPAAMDGDVVVDRAQVDFMQVAG